MVRVAIDFSVFAGPGPAAWGMVNGEIDLPAIPTIGDKVPLAQQDDAAFADLGAPEALRVESVVSMREQWPDWNHPVDMLLALEDVVLETAEAAERFARLLTMRLGLVALPWSEQS